MFLLYFYIFIVTDWGWLYFNAKTCSWYCNRGRFFINKFVFVS